MNYKFLNSTVILFMLLPNFIWSSSVTTPEEASESYLPGNCVAITHLCGLGSVNVKVECRFMNFDPGATCYEKECYSTPLAKFCKGRAKEL